MFAVIETGGKQYKVQYGDVIYVEKLNAAENDTVEFPVVAVFGEEGTKIGAPYVEVPLSPARWLRTARPRKSPCSPTSPRRIPSARWAIASPTPRCRLRP